MEYTLPHSLRVCGTDYPIRWDYRAALDICAALCDPELNDQERALAVLLILYPDADSMPVEHCSEALERALWYINGGAGESKSAAKKPVLMSWEQDWPLIVSAVNRVVGRDVRGIELHWWSLLSAYMEIGDCTFAQVVGIRAKKSRGQKLSKEERAWERENRDIVELRRRYSSDETALLAAWGGNQSTEVTQYGE